MLDHPIVQVAYFVNDVRRAAVNMAKQFGAGPFIVVDNIELAWCEHRGRDHRFIHTSAYGQWGDVMMELVQQEDSGPSPFRDVFPTGEGLHHMAMMVDSLPDTYAECQALGLTVACRAATHSGTEFAFIDAPSPMAHMIEVYERSPQLVGFYDTIRNIAEDWDGKDPVRDITSL